MSEWYTVADMSKKTNIPQQTLRRYMQQHKHLLRIRKEHRSYQLHQECAEILKKIREAYKSGKTQDEIDKLITNSGIPMTIDVVDESSGEQISVSATEALEEIKAQLEEQKQFNETLIELFKAQAKRMDEQQKYFQEAITKKDEMLMESLRETKEVQQLLLDMQEVKEEEPEQAENVDQPSEEDLLKVLDELKESAPEKSKDTEVSWWKKIFK